MDSVSKPDDEDQNDLKSYALHGAVFLTERADESRWILGDALNAISGAFPLISNDIVALDSAIWAMLYDAFVHVENRRTYFKTEALIKAGRELTNALVSANASDEQIHSAQTTLAEYLLQMFSPVDRESIIERLKLISKENEATDDIRLARARYRLKRRKHNLDVSQMNFDFTHWSDSRHTGELKLLIDPGESPPELIAELYTALDSLYRAHGGSGLTISKDECRAMSAEVLR